VVLIDDRAHEPTQLPSVATTNEAGAAAAARHLLEQGRVRPLVVSGPERFGCTGQRLTGFAREYVAAGHPSPPTGS
jgi:LacI family transcriptional regulator